MGRLERHLDQQKVAQVLAAGITPHRHASNKAVQPKALPPVRPVLIVGKWPTPAYAVHRNRPRAKAAGEHP